MRGSAPLTGRRRRRRSRRAAYVDAVVARVAGHEDAEARSVTVRSAIAGVHVAVCRAMGVPAGDAVGELAGPVRPGRWPGLEPPAGEADPRLLGEVYEALLSREGRRRGGVFYTPAATADRVVAWAVEAVQDTAAPADLTVCDPTMGGGSFLLAAAGALVGRGTPPVDAIRHGLFGADLDPLAVAVSRAALTAWLGRGEGPPPGALVAADVVEATTATWPRAPSGGFAAVVGNPPFLGQLARRTVRATPVAAAVRARFGDAVGPYTDTAGVVLLVALELARAGGAVVLLQPESVLAARDSGPVRRAIARSGSLRSIWFAGADVFDADVRVCVPVVVKGDAPAPGCVRVRSGAEAHVVDEVAGHRAVDTGTWGGLAAVAAGIPGPPIASGGGLGDWCRATAGFRDEYYGLVPFVQDGPPELGPGEAAVVTSGLLDPARCLWGGRPARFARQSWTAPRVPVAALAAEPRLARWSAAQRAPKLLVATQTRVVEVVVDETGDLLGSTPVITVTCPPDRLWHAAAVLLSPVVTAWARRRTAGTALSADAVKLSARQVLDVPVPPAGPAWDRAASAVRVAHGAADADAWRTALVDAATWSTRAYRVDDLDGLVAWWEARLPAWR